MAVFIADPARRAPKNTVRFPHVRAAHGAQDAMEGAMGCCDDLVLGSQSSVLGSQFSVLTIPIVTPPAPTSAVSRWASAGAGPTMVLVLRVSLRT